MPQIGTYYSDGEYRNNDSINSNVSAAQGSVQDSYDPAKFPSYKTNDPFEDGSLCQHAQQMTLGGSAGGVHSQEHHSFSSQKTYDEFEDDTTQNAFSHLPQHETATRAECEAPPVIGHPCCAAPSSSEMRQPISLQNCLDLTSTQAHPRERSRSPKRSRNRRRLNGSSGDNADNIDVATVDHHSNDASDNQDVAVLEKQLPPATEETWQRRIDKREEGLIDLRKSVPYKENQDGQRSKRPVTPDPLNRNLSKRDWEKAMSDCRRSWRRIHIVKMLLERGFDENIAIRNWELCTKGVKGNDLSEAHFAEVLRMCKVEKLHLMGFSKKNASAALKSAEGDMDKAVDILLSK